LSTSGQEIFVAVKTYSNEGLEPMRRVLRILSVHFSIERVSSIYSIHRAAQNLTGLRDIRKEEFMQGLALVFKARTTLTPHETIELLRSAESDGKKETLRRAVSLNLLMFGDRVTMTPDLAVPHPEMHLRPEEIVLINEIQGDIVHPVIGEPLADLARQFTDIAWGDFFAQGSAALDFSLLKDDS
jgi:7,8-dihydro-6-hydroxymethylpterin-pyrophosphokinase